MGRYVGRTDESILPESRQEILSRKMKNEYPPADIVFTSPMRRCIETAQIIYPGQRHIVIPDLRECDFGEFELKSHEELNGRADYQAWIESGGRDAFPGGESLDTVRKRCMRGFYRALEIAEDPDVAMRLASDADPAMNLASDPALAMKLASDSDPAMEYSSGPGFSVDPVSGPGSVDMTEPDPFRVPADSVAFVVHGGTIMSILSVICGGDFYDYRTGNGDCVTYTIDPLLM